MNQYEPQERQSCNTMKIVREEIRKSYRDVQMVRQEKNFKEKREQFLLVFQKHGLTEQSPLSQNINYWFLEPNKTSVPAFQDPQMIFKKCLSKDRFIATNVGQFVDQLIKEMEEIHMMSLNFDIDESISRESEKIIGDIIQMIKTSSQYEYEQNLLRQSLNKNTPVNQQLQNSIDIFYIQDKSYKHDIFNYYHLKYKASLIGQQGQQICEHKTVYSDKKQQEQKCCKLELNQYVDAVEIQILGKKISEKNKDYYPLSSVQIPMYEILSAISPSSFENPQIPPSYLIIPYNVNSDLKFSDTKNPIEMEIGVIFNINLSYRAYLLEQHALPFYTMEKRRQHNNKYGQITLIQNILSYFEDVDLQYKPQDGIEIRKPKMESGCYTSCNIF